MPTLLEVYQSRLGVQEIPGKKHNKVIVAWAKAVGLEKIKDDETSWCSISCASAAKEAGLPYPAINTAMARSWLTWGVRVERGDIQPSDVAIWPRGNPAGPFGHVNVVEDVVGSKVVCIGGNQGGLKGGDAVTRSKPRAIADALDFRRPVPATVTALRKAGSKEVKQADRLQGGGVLAIAVAVATSVWGSAKTFLAQGLSIEHLAIVGLGIILIGAAYRIKAARVRKHAAGMPLSGQI